MKKGFTLIELLAVIIVLAVIALITTPTVLKVVGSARDKSDLESVHGIVDSARLYYSESMLDTAKRLDIDNLNNVYEKISLSNKPNGGMLYVNSKGQVMLSVKIRNKCYKKMFNSEIEVTTDEDCSLGIDMTKPTVMFSVDEVFNENGWAKESFNINITVTDDESGPNGYKYCIDTKNCTPVVMVNNSTGFAEISNNSETNKVCVIGVDNYGNESNTVCSDSYKLDSAIPALTDKGENITIQQGDNHLVSIYFNEPIYGISGGTLSCEPDNTSTLSIGNQMVSCTAISNSGLSVTRNKTIIVTNNTFNLTYGGSENETAQSIIKTSDGGYVLVGYTYSNDGDITDGNNGSTDILVMKLNSNGSKVWDKTYGGSESDIGYSIIQTSDGGYILVGDTYSNDGDITDGNNGSVDILVMKLNSDGTKVWDKTYGGTKSETAQSIIQANDGGYVLVGYTKSSDGDITSGHYGDYGYTDILVMKLNSDGTKVWDKTYGGNWFDEVNSIVQSNDGGYVLVGRTSSIDGDITDGNNGSFDILVMKLNSDGTKVWIKTYGGTKSETAQSIIQANDGGYVLLGETSSNDGDITDGNNGSTDILVMKLNNVGNQVWIKTYGGTKGETAQSIVQSNDGGYVLVGRTASNDGDITGGNKGSNDILMMKLNSSGSKVWDKTFGGSENDMGYSIIQTDDEGYLLLGSTSSNNGDIISGNKGLSDILIVKFDSGFNY